MQRKSMWTEAGSVLLLAVLASCGSSNTDGSGASGPLGQKPLMTPEVQAATRQGLDACIDALKMRIPISALQARGFAPWRGGYRLRIDNPLIFAGGSSVSAKIERDACQVSTGPVFPIELQTITAITNDALNARGHEIGVRFRRSGDRIEVILR